MPAAFLALVLALSAALADDERYTTAIAQFQAFEYEQALLRFESLVVAPERTVDEQATLLAWIAVCSVELGNDDRGRAAFEDALRRSPSVQLPTTVSPKIQALFDEAKAAAAAQAVQAPTQPPVEAAAVVVEEGPPLMLFTGLGLAGAGVAALVGTGVLAAVAVGAAGRAADPTGFQSDNVAAANEANVEIGAAVVLAALGAAAVAGGGAALLFAFE